MDGSCSRSDVAELKMISNGRDGLRTPCVCVPVHSVKQLKLLGVEAHLAIVTEVNLGPRAALVEDRVP